MAAKLPATVDEYIAACAPEVQPVLRRVRALLRMAVPEASETISYRMPALAVGKPLVYFAAFKRHIGLYPPVRGDARLLKAVARYANAKGNLAFPLDEPLPAALITRVARRLALEQRSRASARRARS